MEKKEKKPLIKIDLDALSKGIFENDYSVLWEDKFKQKTEILEDNGKTTNLVVKVASPKLLKFFSKDKNESK